MAIYITQGNYTAQAMKGMIDSPEDRVNAVAALMDSVGAKLLHMYMTTGEYDFLTIAEGDDVTDLMAGLMVAGSSGGVANLKTVQAITTAEAKAAMEKAKAVRAAYRPIGGAS